MTHPISCRCGNFKAEFAGADGALRMACYCRDCQTAAHHLDQGQVLDEGGGIDVIQTSPDKIQFTQGESNLACLCLSPKGLLRWYASCCNTMLFNMPRQPKMHFASVLHCALADSPEAFEQKFGPRRGVFSVGGAVNGMKPKQFGTLAAIWRISTQIAGARLTGRYRKTPFFSGPELKPVVEPTVISKEERARARPSD